jgi:hypothetical protein
MRRITSQDGRWRQASFTEPTVTFNSFGCSTKDAAQQEIWAYKKDDETPGSAQILRDKLTLHHIIDELTGPRIPRGRLVS